MIIFSINYPLKEEDNEIELMSQKAPKRKLGYISP